VISGYPLTERRLLAGFSNTAQSIGNPDFVRGLMDIIGKTDDGEHDPRAAARLGRSFLQRWAGTT